jgi:hypothetical protein
MTGRDKMGPHEQNTVFAIDTKVPFLYAERHLGTYSLELEVSGYPPVWLDKHAQTRGQETVVANHQSPVTSY